MTKEEEKKCWRHFLNRQPENASYTIDGKKILDWNTDDGGNGILLDGEDFYRQVVIKG